MKKGFTLVELVITLAIISILIGVAVASYTSFAAKGRDSKRQSDLRTLQSAPTQYRADQGKYPATLTAGQPLTNISKTRTYLQKVPSDPLTSKGTYPQYSYRPMPDSCDNSTTPKSCTGYCLYANLEDAATADRSSVCLDKEVYNFELPSP